MSIWTRDKNSERPGRSVVTTLVLARGACVGCCTSVWRCGAQVQGAMVRYMIGWGRGGETAAVKDGVPWSMCGFQCEIVAAVTLQFVAVAMQCIQLLQWWIGAEVLPASGVAHVCKLGVVKKAKLNVHQHVQHRLPPIAFVVCTVH